MSAPFGKVKKSPQQNTACFLVSTNAHIDNYLNKSTCDSKALKKYDKYKKRMVEIVNGKLRFWTILNTSTGSI